MKNTLPGWDFVNYQDLGLAQICQHVCVLCVFFNVLVCMCVGGCAGVCGGGCVCVVCVCVCWSTECDMLLFISWWLLRGG